MAREVLENLAKGMFEDRLTREAQASLQRLGQAGGVGRQCAGQGAGVEVGLELLRSVLQLRLELLGPVLQRVGGLVAVGCMEPATTAGVETTVRRGDTQATGAGEAFRSTGASGSSVRRSRGTCDSIFSPAARADSRAEMSG